MLATLNDWTNFLDNGDGVDVIFFEKASDEEQHTKLIEELSVVGLYLRTVNRKSFLSQLVYTKANLTNSRLPKKCFCTRPQNL